MGFDIAVDPLECTTLCGDGLPGSLATIAFAATGSMASLGVAFYMDKLVGAPALRGVLDLTAAPESSLERAAAALHSQSSNCAWWCSASHATSG